MNMQIAVRLTLALVCVVSSPAAQIVGGSNLLSVGDVVQFESWLGGGPLTLVSLFSRTAGDGKTASAFHAAADGKGPTFSVLRVRPQGSTGAYSIIGGYNPQSWSSINDYNLTPSLAQRTAFLFNLTSSFRLLQRTDTSNGAYQTYNAGPYGPTFGNGHDLVVHNALGTGYVVAVSYVAGGACASGCINLLGAPAAQTHLEISDVEVFGIAPEPGTWAAGVFAAIGLAAARRNRAG